MNMLISRTGKIVVLVRSFVNFKGAIRTLHLQKSSALIGQFSRWSPSEIYFAPYLCLTGGIKELIVAKIWQIFINKVSYFRSLVYF